MDGGTEKYARDTPENLTKLIMGKEVQAKTRREVIEKKENGRGERI